MKRSSSIEWQFNLKIEKFKKRDTTRFQFDLSEYENCTFQIQNSFYKYKKPFPFKERALKF
ncbi:hypothetical protein [Bacillus subtilis]|uniref:hypothetical protein n=1 Tax=Bacillus subtilis TaxID=1423 RepID=UPI0023ED9E66|nr:hypothetical protein [Bacillus subtilis]MDF4200403.1 hypothetical protein [Bacillus subtilis]MDF4218738.1 hypothetical protein [Bacillus subtilis]